MRYKRSAVSLLIAGSIFLFPMGPASAQAEDVYRGIPQVTIELMGLDSSGQFIYVGVDLAVFQDEDHDGVFRVMEDKVLRLLTTSINITIDLGDAAGYMKGCRYKLAKRTLYTPAGADSGIIIIADYDNGKEGWVLIPGTEFQPSYFASPSNDFIFHTKKWEQNWTLYNLRKEEAGLSQEVRSRDVFWSGEKLVIQVETTGTVPYIEASISGTEYKTALEASEITSEGAIYSGVLWDKEMMFQWGNFSPKELEAVVSVYEDGEVSEAISAGVIMDNRDLFYRVKRAY